MAGFFSSANAKLARANEVMEDLCKELNDHSGAYSLEVRPSPDFTRYSLHVVISGDQPFERWSTVVGDCLQNLRCVLDHSIYGLAFSRSHPNLPNNWTKLYFPICDDEAQFTGRLHQIGDLRFEARVVDVIRSLQPYNRGKPGWVPPLAVLRDLNNLDKHRDIVITHGRPWKFALEYALPPETITCITEETFDAPIVNGAKLWAIQLSEPFRDFSLKVEGELAPAIRQRLDLGLAGTDGDTTWIDQVLNYVRDEVSHCLSVIEQT